MESRYRSLPVVTVSQVNRVVGSIIKSDKRLANVLLCGEIIDFRYHEATGHMYFALKDESARIRAVMFRGNAVRLNFSPKNGDKVLCAGAITVYEPNGVYQINCAEMELDGAGEQAAALEALKRRLYSEGVFSQKRPIPKRPKKIAVITAPGGAALQDIINVISRRYPLVTLVVVPALVQGENAAKSVADCLARAQSTGADVIIFGRGGGSSDDLSAFNTEIAARAVFASKIPTISAVGHEIDTTLVDYAADLRAPTPSAAAELAVPDIAELYDNLDGFLASVRTNVNRMISERERTLVSCSGLIRALSPKNRIVSWEQKRKTLADNINLRVRTKLEAAERALAKNAEVISALNPLGVLARGYSVTYHGGRIVTSSSELKAGDKIEVRLANGGIEAEVLSASETE